MPSLKPGGGVEGEEKSGRGKEVRRRRKRGEAASRPGSAERSGNFLMTP